MIGHLLQADLAELVRERNFNDLREALVLLDPPDIAEVISDLPADEEGFIFRVLPRDRAAAVFSYLPLEHQEGLIKSLSGETTHAIVSPDGSAIGVAKVSAPVTRISAADRYAIVVSRPASPASRE